MGKPKTIPPVMATAHISAEFGKCLAGKEATSSKSANAAELARYIQECAATLQREVLKSGPQEVRINDLLSDDKLAGSGGIANILGQNDGFPNKIAVAMRGTGTEFVMGHGTGGLGFSGTGTAGDDQKR